VEQGAKALGYAQLITLNKLMRTQGEKSILYLVEPALRTEIPISLLEAYNLRNTHGLIAGNQDAAEVLQQHGYQGPIKVMPQLGVDESRFRSSTTAGIEKPVENSTDDFVVGFVGRFVAEKGLLTLGKALAGLQGRPWKWLLLGRGPLQSELMKKPLSGASKIRLIWVESVPHDEVPRYINVMDTLVLPSETNNQFKTLTAAGWKEQFGHVLIEAMASKVPVIGSDSGEIPYVIEDAGLVFPEGDVAALQTCLQQLMEQPELAKSWLNWVMNEQ
jgi:glycosyltransferase involved in cell wall biosynthesis